MKRPMKLSERVLMNRYEKQKQEIVWVQIIAKINRPIAYEFKRLARARGFTYTEIIDTAIQQFIEEQKSMSRKT